MTGDADRIPDGWQAVRLGEVAAVNPKRPRLSAADDAAVPFIPMAAVGENCAGILVREEREYRAVRSGYTYFEENDVLFSKITPCLQNGKHALARQITGGFGFGTTEFHVVRAGAGLDPRHLFRVLTQPQNIERCTRSFSGTAGQQRVQPEILRSLPTLLPPLPEQRAIAAVLDSIDEAIERTEEVIAATERVRDALLHELLTRGLPGRHSEWTDVPGLGTVPACWDVVRLGEMCERITKGTTPTTLGYEYAESGVRFLRVENIAEGKIEGGESRFIAEEAHRALTRSVLKKGDLLLSIAGALGRSALVTTDVLPANVNQALAIIRLDDNGRTFPGFVSLSLRAGAIRTQVDDMRSELAQANINLQQVASLRVPLPPVTEQQAIVATLDGIDASIERAREERARLHSLQAAAADALLTGRVRVTAETLER